MRLVIGAAGWGLLVVAGVAAGQRPTSPTPKAKTPAPASSAPAAPAPDTVHHFSGVVGVAIDSVHGGPLRGAVVSVAGTARQGITDTLGQFRIDSVPPGEYKLTLSHPMLDSIGLGIATQSIAMPVARYAVVRLSTPSAATLLDLFCPRDKRLTGPGALIGRVRDADTDAPSTGARVVLYWTELEVGKAVGVHRIPRVREATVDESGSFRICGIPPSVQGSLRASRGGSATADVPIQVQGELVTLASLHLSPPDTVVTASAPAAGAPPPVAPPKAALRRGSAVVAGRVTDRGGRPLSGAEVSVLGAEATTVSNDSGQYTLRGLPSGTQALIVRKVSFSPAHQTVDLASRAPQHADVRLTPAPPTLTTVQVEGKREKGLREVGFTARQKSGMGRYLTEEQIANKMPTVMTDIFTTVPGLTINYSNGDPEVRSSRNAGGGCVNYVIDGVPAPIGGGDFNDYMRPEEVAAVEVYQSSEAPAQYAAPGRSDCAVILIWTKTRVGG